MCHLCFSSVMVYMWHSDNLYLNLYNCAASVLSAFLQIIQFDSLIMLMVCRFHEKNVHKIDPSLALL